MRPHYYCLPVLKREEHRRALVAAATSGSAKFFLGTDSAPHAAHLKEHASGCAGCYTALRRSSCTPRPSTPPARSTGSRASPASTAPAFYGLPRNTGTVTLRTRAWTLPEALPFGEAELKPLRGGETLAWRLVHERGSA